MTVSYTGDVANGSSFGCFWKILGRWKGSVYKLVWRELVVYLTVYFIINITYRHGLDLPQRGVFEKLKVYCSKQIESIPMSFVLGFYVTLIVKRWWDQYWILPLPDSLALYINASIQGQYELLTRSSNYPDWNQYSMLRISSQGMEERPRILRRTIMRYAMLSYIIMLQRISVRVKKRFPTLQHLVDTGLMMESEKKIFDGLEAKTTISKFWMPLIWASNLVTRARSERLIDSDHMVQTIQTELSDFRRRLGRVGIYDTVSVPLVYTQVVTLAVYTYFMAALIGRQWVHPVAPEDRSTIYPAFEVDLYFPIFLSLQFCFYIGWLKVAETLINPFGEDDDDFELNWLIDRHIQVSYMVVDEIHEDHPELLKDQYWDQVVPAQLPYNEASTQYRQREPKGSTASMKIKESECIYDNLFTSKRHSVIPDEVYADYESVTDSPLVDNRKTWLQRQISRVESFRSTSSSSSLFNRNRSQRNQNGGIPSTHNSAGHRLSLYEKLMNRRSSKDSRNLSKIPPTAMPRNNAGGQLMPSAIARPRVPTPEVTKETQINMMATVPNQTPPGILVNKNSTGPLNHHHPLTLSLSAEYGQRTVANSVTGGNIGHVPVNGGIYPSRIPYHQSPPQNKRPLSPISKSPPPSYDSTDAPHVMLTPIEENDSSPYSTSSTNRSSKSSIYPTTNSIFSRKASPPPPKEELRTIPTAVANETRMRGSEHSPANSHNMETALIRESDFEEPYMTIEEVGETKSGLTLREEGQPSLYDDQVVLARRSHNHLQTTVAGNNDVEYLVPRTHSRQSSFDKSTNTDINLSINSDIPAKISSGLNNMEGHVNMNFEPDSEVLTESFQNQNNSSKTPAKDCEVFV